MQPYITQCRLQAALQCPSPELPIKSNYLVSQKAPLPNPVPNNTDQDSSTDRESFTIDAKSSPDRDTEYDDLTDAPPVEDFIDQVWTYDTAGGKGTSRLVSLKSTYLPL